MLSILGGQYMYDSNQFENLAKFLEPFLATILDFTLFECGFSTDVILRENVANTLMTLISCFPQTYQNLVEQMIQNQVQNRSEPGLGEELRKTFDSLMAGIPLNQAKYHRNVFKQRFETFVDELQGLICLK